MKICKVVKQNNGLLKVELNKLSGTFKMKSFIIIIAIIIIIVTIISISRIVVIIILILFFL